jgi:RNA polymerase sigma-54 factor
MDLPAPPIEALALFLVSELREDGILDVSLDELAEETGAPLPTWTGARGAAILRTGRDRRARPARMPEAAARRPGPARGRRRRDRGRDGAFRRPRLGRHRPRLGIDRAEAEHRAGPPAPAQPAPGARADAAPVLSQPDLILTRDARHAGRRVNAARHLAPGPLDPRSSPGPRRPLRARTAGTRARLIAALEQRGRTLQRIGDWLVARQAGFFLRGPEALRPATRAELAADLGLHPATVGRAIAGKSIDVDGRLWPLAPLFHRPAGAERRGLGPRRAAPHPGPRRQRTPRPPLSDAALPRAARRGR